MLSPDTEKQARGSLRNPGRFTLARLATPVNTERRGQGRYLLHYTHYSVAMHRERRLAIFAAANIDGALATPLKRSGSEPWARDPRIPAERQHANALYAGNDLDRGHLVRRLDPAWGPEAVQGEHDTFFFTNCAPQHEEFNQRIWLGLEDYLLQNATTRGFQASVFTGPVFREQDRPYREALLPGAFWKVAAMVKTEAEELSVTGYLISQADLLTDVEFAYGQFRTYQVALSQIEAFTGLDFGDLKQRDPLAAIEGLAVSELGELDEIQL